MPRTPRPGLHAQDSTSGLQGMDLQSQAVTVGGPSDPETETIQTAPLSPRSMTGQATSTPAPDSFLNAPPPGHALQKRYSPLRNVWDEGTSEEKEVYEEDEEEPDASTVLGHKLPTPDRDSRTQLPIALLQSMPPALQDFMSLIFSPSSADTRAGSALSTNSTPSIRNAHISSSKPHGEQQNYLRIRQKQKQIGVLGQDRDSLKTEDDVSWLDNEECEDDFVENGDDNGPSSPDTMSKRSFSTQSTISTVSSKLSKMLS